jgi:hypothetical protein
MKDYICSIYDKCSRRDTCDHAKPHDPDPNTPPGDDEDCINMPCPGDDAPRQILCRKIEPDEKLIIGY